MTIAAIFGDKVNNTTEQQIVYVFKNIYPDVAISKTQFHIYVNSTDVRLTFDTNPREWYEMY